MTRALLLIDIQKTFRDGTWGARNNDFAEKNAAKLLTYFREKAEPVIHINHRSSSPQSRFYDKGQGFAFQEEVAPLVDEPVISKTVNSAFIETNLKTVLEEKGIDTLIIAGLTLPHCISTTTRMAGNFGFSTYLVEDAVASFDMVDHNDQLIPAQVIHDVSIATLHDEFATIVSTEDILSGKV